MASTAVAGDHHHDRLGVDLPQPRQRLDPVHPLHLDVEEDELRADLGIHFERVGAVGGGVHLEALEFENLLQGFADALLVVDDQDAPAHARRRR